MIRKTSVFLSGVPCVSGQFPHRLTWGGGCLMSLKFTWKNKYVIIVKQLDKDYTLLMFKTHYKANVIKSAWNWHRNRKRPD